jgi:hypothetical protein
MTLKLRSGIRLEMVVLSTSETMTTTKTVA